MGIEGYETILIKIYPATEVVSMFDGGSNGS
jgi:hypothetical protein